jgi:hypothetical protein
VFPLFYFGTPTVVIEVFLWNQTECKPMQDSLQSGKTLPMPEGKEVCENFDQSFHRIGSISQSPIAKEKVTKKVS